MADFQSVFEAFASFGTAPSTEIDNSHFSKMLKECKIIDTKYTTTDADLCFNRCKSKGARKLTFQQMRDLVVPEIAQRKKVSPESIIAQISASAPASSGTKADAVKFHDDKSQYTGVYAAGGPTNVDRDPANLASHIDRRNAADVRGATGGANAGVNVAKG